MESRGNWVCALLSLRGQLIILLVVLRRACVLSTPAATLFSGGRGLLMPLIGILANSLLVVSDTDSESDSISGTDGNPDTYAWIWQDDTLTTWYENLDGFGTFSGEKVYLVDFPESYTSSSTIKDDQISYVNSPVAASGIKEGKDTKVTSRRHDAHWSSDLVPDRLQVLGAAARDEDRTSSSDAAIASPDNSGSVALDTSQSNSAGATWVKDATEGNTPDVLWVVSAGMADEYRTSPVDIDGDGDADILATSQEGSGVVWYENTDGEGNLVGASWIEEGTNKTSRVCAADIDGDGDLDVLYAVLPEGYVVWHENVDGNGTFSAGVVIEASRHVHDMLVADLDGDGDADLLTISSARGGSIEWLANSDGRATFSSGFEIAVGIGDIRDVGVADLDGDGDLDVVVVAKRSRGAPSRRGNTLSPDVSHRVARSALASPSALTEGISPSPVTSSSAEADGDPEIPWLRVMWRVGLVLSFGFAVALFTMYALYSTSKRVWENIPMSRASGGCVLSCTGNKRAVAEFPEAFVVGGNGGDLIRMNEII